MMAASLGLKIIGLGLELYMLVIYLSVCGLLSGMHNKLHGGTTFGSSSFFISFIN